MLENEKGEEIKIYLIDIDKGMIKAWKKFFSTEKNIVIAHGDMRDFLKTNVEVDSVVSAANSFGIMDGGLDAVAISSRNIIFLDYWGQQMKQLTFLSSWEVLFRIYIKKKQREIKLAL